MGGSDSAVSQPARLLSHMGKDPNRAHWMDDGWNIAQRGIKRRQRLWTCTRGNHEAPRTGQKSEKKAFGSVDDKDRIRLSKDMIIRLEKAGAV